MKATELIGKLTTFVEKVGDIDVDINNSHGTYSKIDDVKIAMWTDKERRLHKVIEIISGGKYDTSETIV